MLKTKKENKHQQILLENQSFDEDELNEEL